MTDPTPREVFAVIDRRGIVWDCESSRPTADESCRNFERKYANDRPYRVVKYVLAKEEV